MTMMSEPPKIDHLLPNLSFTIGMKGRDIMAPKEYAAAMMPLSEPCGLSKSTMPTPYQHNGIYNDTSHLASVFDNILAQLSRE